MVLGDTMKVLDHGYIQCVECWGSDERIIEAARAPTGKGFLGWEAGECPTCKGSRMVWDGVAHSRNYITCTDCGGRGTIPGDFALLHRLWVKKRTTPFEMVGATFEVQAPIMVLREWRRHRTQSCSAWYTPLPDVNEGARVLTAEQEYEYRRALLLTMMDYTVENVRKERQLPYESTLKASVPKELDSLHPEVGHYSRMLTSDNLYNWLRFLTLHMAEDARWEIRQYANALCGMLKERFSKTLSLFMEGKSG